MNGIKDITAIYYDDTKIHEEDQGKTRYLWIEFKGGKYYAFVSILHNRPDLISDELLEIRTQEGYHDAGFAGLGEAFAMHLEMWDSNLPMIFIWDWVNYTPMKAEYDGVFGHIHKFTVK